ncbi:MAG: hypothetical protein IH913_13775, partial [Proteobacteria bacterium]|nr:hypothetical protein [Pseudomonadota bacterium]
AEVLESSLKNAEGIDFLGGGEGITGDQISAGVVGDRQRVAVAAVGEHELALVIGTPQLVGISDMRQRGALRFVAPSLPALDCK